MRDSIEALSTSYIRRGKAILREKKRIQRSYKMLTMLNNILPILSSAVVTYSLFSYSSIKIYILVILSVSTVAVTTYISFSNYAENIAKYEMASSTYIQIGKNLKNLNIITEKSSDWISGSCDAYESMILYFNGMNNSMENMSSSLQSNKRIQSFYETAQSHCSEFLIADSSLKDAYNRGQFFHVFIEHNIVHYCGTHGDAYVNYHFDAEFKKNIIEHTEFESHIKYYDDVKNIHCLSNGRGALCIIVPKDQSENLDDPADEGVEIIISTV
jgi:hypothetical protein